MIGIINCDFDPSDETNGGKILQHLIPKAKLIDITKGEKVKLDDYSAFIVTGSEASFDHPLAWIKYLKKLLIQIHQQRKPTLAICFGMQMVAATFGGMVKTKAVDEEGFYKIKLETKDRLFKGLPENLFVYQSHYDIVTNPPPRSQIMSENKKFVEAFRWDNFWCLQFHLEISSQIAHIIAKKDKKVKRTLAKVSNKYCRPRKIIFNFLEICHI